ncbi:MAG: hypothetical protein IIZ39_05865 [Blautia sp.]|nr:hypothetical protein [Blautia sp.]
MRNASHPAIVSKGANIISNTFIMNMVTFVISSLTSCIGSLIDGVIIGQFLGVDSMAAFGLVSPVIILSALFGAIIASGARNRFALLVSKGEIDEAEGVFTLSMVLSVGLSFVMMFFVFLYITPLCSLLGATGSAARLLPKTRGYLLGITLGLPAVNACRVLSNYMAIDNDRQLPIISSMGLTITDITLDVLIAVMGGDTFGMGLATAISHYVALGILLLHFFKEDRLVRFSFQNMHWEEMGVILSKGLPNGIARVASTARSIILNQILAAIGTASCIAALSVQRQADIFLNPFIYGISDTVILLTGVLVGEENRPMLKRLTKTYVGIIATFIMALSALCCYSAPYFTAFFLKGEPEALSYGIHSVRSYALSMPIYTLGRAYTGYLEGRGKVKLAFLSNLLSEGILIVLAAFLLLPSLGVHAVWYAFPLAQTMCAVILLVIIALMNVREKAKNVSFWDWILALPTDFDVPESDRIDQTISSQDEVIALSKAAWDFCDAHGCDHKRKYAISLAVEELATNTILTGFRQHRHNTIDMRILKKGDDYILRMRDDCEIFDPVKQLQLYDRNVPLRHVGLRLAISNARNVQYTTMLRLNNLVLRV